MYSNENGSKRTGEDEEELVTLTLILWGDVATSEGVILGEDYKPPPRILQHETMHEELH